MVDAVSTVVDLRPIVDQVIIPVLIPLAGSLFTWGVWKVVSLLGLHISAAQAQVIDRGLQYGVDYATTKVEGYMPGKVPVDVHNAAVATVTQYAMDHIPDALAYFNIDRAKLVAMVEARLESIPTDPAQLPQASQAPADAPATHSMKPPPR